MECWCTGSLGNGGREGSISGLKDILSPLQLIVSLDAAGPFRDVLFITVELVTFIE